MGVSTNETDKIKTIKGSGTVDTLTQCWEEWKWIQ